MINKKYMNYIRKELKKENPIIISYLPSKEEQEYLKQFNIKTEIVIIKRQSIITDNFYNTECCKYTLNF